MIHKKKVLLVDDDEISLFINRKLLSKFYKIDRFDNASNGNQALDLYRQYIRSGFGYPDVVFLDLHMPGMDGFEFLRIFYSLDFPYKDRTLLIVLTSSFNQSDIARVRDLGVKHYLVKPLNEIELAEILKY